MLTNLSLIKKVPRVLLLAQDELQTPLEGVSALWPDRSESPVLELSLGGMLIQTHPRVGKLKPGQSLDFRLRIQGVEESVPVKALLLREQNSQLGFVFESMTATGRLTLDQTVREKIIVQSLREQKTSDCQLAWQPDMWLHGAFDTNVLIGWSDADASEVRRAHIEFENLAWSFEEGEFNLQKSVSTVEENHDYFHPLHFPLVGNVSAGASWLDRLLKCLQQTQDKRGDLQPLIELLGQQRKR